MAGLQPNPIITLFLVDDHTVVRTGTHQLIETNPRFKVVGQATNGKEALEHIPATNPDIILLDINLPEENGFVLFPQIRARCPLAKIIFFSAHRDVPYITKALQLDADGYISKTVETGELHQLLQHVVQTGEPVFSHDIGNELHRMKNTPAQSQLTPREMEILMAVAKGQSNKEIAAEVFVSVKTVDTHVANIMKKLGLNKRTQLLNYAYEQGWL